MSWTRGDSTGNGLADTTTRRDEAEDLEPSLSPAPPRPSAPMPPGGAPLPPRRCAAAPPAVRRCPPAVRGCPLEGEAGRGVVAAAVSQAGGSGAPYRHAAAAALRLAQPRRVRHPAVCDRRAHLPLQCSSNCGAAPRRPRSSSSSSS
eukprot:COSAG01_NODE_546_length_15649_cov_21.047395_5_plen_147_part_00